MKSVLLLILLSFQLHSQNNLFRHNQDPYSDFDYSEKEILELKSEGNLSIFNAEKHNSNLANKLFELSEGKSITLKGREKKKLKIIKKKNVEHFRVNYIYFDGDKMSYEEIDKLRDRILMMNKTQKFERLAQRYSMDMNKNKGGDSGWFKKSSVPEDFKNAALSSIRAANETFKVDLEDKGWYYLILKSYSPQLIEEILVLETIE
ncbi:peptidylprolyl isomerase [Psychroflexus lacisalsi]|jgi:parvulin-like peptidyl-prolyl isomerase|uniref:PpiC domain-containing protein n=1 Tax=Psychroflexus lacisalsi TaxID=503928 RepID=A0ABN1KAC1_9FLAO|nr:peptidyl-prolyl cis-trans isomerase [Psychroflexus lacisalsi]MBZ9620025.1 peptidyl-prolyl cis-trans isomerase [Psychroflexus lacisalsi]